MSLINKTHSGRRPRCARPMVEALEDVCLMSAAPGLAHVAAHAARPPRPPRPPQPPQPPMQQVRATLKAAGIPACLQAKMCRATLLADYQKALGGTTWQVRYRRPVRHCGPYLVEVPPATPAPPPPTTSTTPATPPPATPPPATPPPATPPSDGNPANVMLSPPTLGVQSVATRDAKLTLKAGPGGAPFGFEVLLAPLAAYQAAGNTFPAHETTTTTAHIALTGGQVVTLDYPGLNPGTQYIARAVALPGSTTTPAPGTDYLRSNPSPDLVFSTRALVQLDAPTIRSIMVGPDAATIAVAPGETGAPFGILVRVATLADYEAEGGHFPPARTIETTLSGPLAPGEPHLIHLAGLDDGTEYVVQAIALAGSRATPEPGVDYIQSPPSMLAAFGTEPATIQAAPPILTSHAVGNHSVQLNLTAGAQGAPGGWTVQYTTFQDHMVHGWDNAMELSNVTPVMPGQTADVAVDGLHPHTDYVFRARADGGGNVLASDWSNWVEAMTLPNLG